MPKGIPNSEYTGEFKQSVIEDIVKNDLSYREAMRKYGITGKCTIEKWERIYLEEGAKGLYVERRGRGSGSGRGRPHKLDKEIENDLISEVQRLRAENDYLKNLHALVQERERREKKRK